MRSRSRAFRRSALFADVRCSATRCNVVSRSPADVASDQAASDPVTAGLGGVDYVCSCGSCIISGESSRDVCFATCIAADAHPATIGFVRHNGVATHNRERRCRSGGRCADADAHTPACSGERSGFSASFPRDGGDLCFSGACPASGISGRWVDSGGRFCVGTVSDSRSCDGGLDFRCAGCIAGPIGPPVTRSALHGCGVFRCACSTASPPNQGNVAVSGWTRSPGSSAAAQGRRASLLSRCTPCVNCVAI